MDNSMIVKTQGLDVFMSQQIEKYTCPKCGGIISMHDFECSECQWKAE